MGVVDLLISLGDRIHARFGTTSDPAAEWVDVGGERVAVVRTASPDGPGPHPLVIGLHGFGSDERQIPQLVPLLETRSHAHYVSLRGGWTVDGGGHAWFPIEAASPDEVTVDPEHVNEAVERLAATIAAIATPADVDADRIWVVGYSQGAPTALELLARHPDLVRGVAVGAGSFIDDAVLSADLQHAECFVASSTSDPFVSTTDYVDAIDRLRDAGAAVDVCEEHVPHVISVSQAVAIDDWLAERVGAARD